MARLTLWGIYQYDKTLLDNIVLPDGIDKDNLVSEIMRNSGDLYPYHQVPEYLKRNITFWFSRRLFDFDRMYQSLRMEYSPIENYDRIEDIKREYKDSGTDTDNTQGSGSNEKGVSAYNEDGYTNREKDTETHNSNNTQTYNSTVTNTGSGSDKTQTDYGKQRTETENTRIHGNIGVTTSQQMIESEMSLRAKYDIYKIISKEFEREFLVQIY